MDYENTFTEPSFLHFHPRKNILKGNKGCSYKFMELKICLIIIMN